MSDTKNQKLVARSDESHITRQVRYKNSSGESSPFCRPRAAYARRLTSRFVILCHYTAVALLPTKLEIVNNGNEGSGEINRLHRRYCPISTRVTEMVSHIASL